MVRRGTRIIGHGILCADPSTQAMLLHCMALLLAVLGKQLYCEPKGQTVANFALHCIGIQHSLGTSCHCRARIISLQIIACRTGIGRTRTRIASCFHAGIVLIGIAGRTYVDWTGTGSTFSLHS